MARRQRRRLDRALTSLGGFALPYLLAVRNMFRRRGRLVLSLALLATGGGLFMTAVSVRDGWWAMADHVMTDRAYHASFLLTEPVPVGRIRQALAPVGGIREIEVWQSSQTAVARKGQLDVMRTYPDRGHGSFALLGVPPETTMIRFPVIEGRWLTSNDIDAVVLTPHVLRQVSPAKVGDRILLSMDGKPVEWTIVGVVMEIGGGGAYVSSAGYARASGAEGTGSDVRLVTSASTIDERDRGARAAERALDEAGIGVQRSMPLGRLHAAMVGHVEVPVRMLIAASVLLALIGGLGLASVMTVNVLERTRELGVMRAIGAKPSVILKVIVGEGVLIAAMSWFVALLLALPLTRVLGLVAGHMFGAPLPFTISVPAAIGWLGSVLVVAAAASAVPALRASRLVVREALSYE